jgi:hypothetical protein
MARSSSEPEAAYVVASVDGKLVIERRGAPFRKRYVILAVLLLLVLGLLIGYLIGTQSNPRLWFVVALVMIMLLALSERAVRMYAATKPDRLELDKEADTILRNGEEVGKPSEVEGVLFRDILDGDRPTNEYAVVLSYENTRRTLVAESHGLPGEKPTLEKVAAALSEYLGVVVRNEPRQAAEYWLDRS